MLAVVVELFVMFGNLAIRTLFNESIAWAEELGADSLAVITFVGAALAIDRSHVIAMELILAFGATVLIGLLHRAGEAAAGLETGSPLRLRPESVVRDPSPRFVPLEIHRGVAAPRHELWRNSTRVGDP